MADHLTKEHRSWNMSRIKSSNTKPELLLRSLLHRAGYRFTVNAPNNRKLLGRPDIILPRYKTIIFVHGCFWHRHKGCKQATTPKTHTEFWQAKFAKNVIRDKRNLDQLKTLGWNVIVVWECELKEPEDVMRLIKRQLVPQTAAYVATPSKSLLAAEETADYSVNEKPEIDFS